MFSSDNEWMHAYMHDTGSMRIDKVEDEFQILAWITGGNDHIHR